MDDGTLTTIVAIAVGWRCRALIWSAVAYLLKTDPDRTRSVFDG